MITRRVLRKRLIKVMRPSIAVTATSTVSVWLTNSTVTFVDAVVLSFVWFIRQHDPPEVDNISVFIKEAFTDDFRPSLSFEETVHH